MDANSSSLIVALLIATNNREVVITREHLRRAAQYELSRPIKEGGDDTRIRLVEKKCK